MPAAQVGPQLIGACVSGVHQLQQMQVCKGMFALQQTLGQTWQQGGELAWEQDLRKNAYCREWRVLTNCCRGVWDCR